MLKLQRLKLPYSPPSYTDIAKACGLSAATVHAILRQGKFPIGNFSSIEKVLLVLNEPIAEYLDLWEQIHEQSVDSKVVVTHPYDNEHQPDYIIKAEALRNAALVYQGSAFPAQQIIRMALDFEDYLRDEIVDEHPGD